MSCILYFFDHVDNNINPYWDHVLGIVLQVIPYIDSSHQRTCIQENVNTGKPEPGKLEYSLSYIAAIVSLVPRPFLSLKKKAREKIFCVFFYPWSGSDSFPDFGRR